MNTKETIQSLFEVVNELREHEEFKRKDFFELIDLSIKIIDLSLKDEIQLKLYDLRDLELSLDEINNTLDNINKTLIVNL
jgi:hypothetical protein